MWPAGAASTGRGCRSRGCGSSSTTGTARWCAGPRRGCSARGCRGRGFGWCCPSWTRRCRRLSRCIDATLRRFGGCPTYALTDNEKTVTTVHVARIPIRNAAMVEAAGHYGLTVATCVVADPESKGGSEATVRISAADLVPCDANLLGAYESFAALEAACSAFCAQVNGRVHASTHRVPAEMLAEEQLRLHRLPGPSLHGRVRGHPHRGGEHAGHRCRRVRLLGAARVAGRDGVGSLSRRAGHRRPCRAVRAGRGLPP